MNDPTTESSAPPGRTAIAASIAYVLALLTSFIVSFVPEGRVWGFNWWGYWPLGVRLALLAVGLAVPFALQAWRRRHVPGAGSRPAVELAVAAVLSGLVFWLLQARTHFLGDGYLLLSLLGAEHPATVKLRALGEGLAHLGLFRLLGSDGEAGALQAHRILSIGAGVLFVLLTLAAGRRLFGPGGRARLFAVGMITAGFSLLWFGYVEYYSLFVLAVAMFVLLGLLAAEGKAPRWLLLPSLALCCFLHVLGVVLLPAAVYLLGRETAPARKAARMRPLIKIALGLVAAIALAAAFHYAYTNSYFVRFAFVPFVPNRFTVEGYWLFSGMHLADWLNLVWLLLPGLPVLLAVLFAGGRRGLPELLKLPSYRFLVLLAVCGLGAIFVFDPKLGMPRDWDLFAFAGVAPAALAFCLLADTRSPLAPARYAGGLIIALGLLVLLPRAAAQVVPETAIAHLESYMSLDAAKSRNVHPVLAEYYERDGRPEEAKFVLERLLAYHPQERIHARGRALAEDHRYEQAAAEFRRAVQLDPLFWNAWASLGMCHVERGNLDSGLVYLDIALGINPHGADLYQHKAAIRLAQGQYDVAEKLYDKSLALDPGALQPRIGKARLYYRTRQWDRYREEMALLLAREDAPAWLFREWGIWLTDRGELEAAAGAYRQGAERGLPVRVVDSLTVGYPQLRRLLQPLFDSTHPRP